MAGRGLFWLEKEFWIWSEGVLGISFLFFLYLFEGNYERDQSLFVDVEFCLVFFVVFCCFFAFLFCERSEEGRKGLGRLELLFWGNAEDLGTLGCCGFLPLWSKGIIG